MFKRAEAVMLHSEDNNPVNIPFLKMPEKQKLVKHLAGGQFRTYLQLGFKPQHLYFCSDETPKENNYCIIDLKENTRVVKIKSLNSGHPIYTVDIGDGYAQLSNLKKIIATTDSSLEIVSKGINPVYEKLPQPSQSFIEKFVEEYNKGNIITEVLVEYEEKTFEEHWYCEQTGERNFDITPPMGKTWIRYWAHKDIYHILKIAKDNTITIRKVEDSYTREQLEALLYKGTLQAMEEQDEFDFWKFIEKNL